MIFKDILYLDSPEQLKEYIKLKYEPKVEDCIVITHCADHEFQVEIPALETVFCTVYDKRRAHYIATLLAKGILNLENKIAQGM